LLDRLIKDDVESGKLPLLLVANAGESYGQTIRNKTLYFMNMYKMQNVFSYTAYGCMSRNILMATQEFSF